ncbi:DUF4252 domain-containing protein [Candidatus Kaistella beijingensis]|uniref:DUF4252 domain-containing protein n=1 Tax=Candidatus Kaistella beijingensis TaxID=2820270 RepID=UPI001CC442A1|nr:DUF4252 domain-containing protein [Candidatus Kaistella beijingensis]UBB89439.1 DUF4252 domain-containing protein [Candidatus Kaistella beijingensis]
MKKFLLIFALFFSHFFNVNAQKDKLDQLFEKYQESDGVTSIKIAKPMFKMLNNLNIGDSELDQIKPLLSKINGLKILIVEKPEVKSDAKDGALKQNLFQNLQNDISASIKNMKYEELMTVHSKNNKIKFLSSDAANGVLENLLLSINSEDNTVLMMLDGKISMDDVNRLIQEAENSTPKTSVVTENISSNGVTQVRNVGNFTGISVSKGVKVNFTQGNNQSVVVETDPDIQQYVSTVVEGGILKISVNSKGKNNLRFKKLLVNVEAPRLSSVNLSSGSLLTTMNTVNEQDFTADISSGANLNADINAKNSVEIEISSGAAGKLDVESQNFSLNGTSGATITVVGKTESAVFNTSSAATCNAQDFVANRVTASSTSGGNLKVQATDQLAATAGSGGSVRYKGKPKTFTSSVHQNSGGSIKPLN